MCRAAWTVLRDADWVATSGVARHPSLLWSGNASIFGSAFGAEPTECCSALIAKPGASRIISSAI
jgi:hypothetical protein